MKILSGIGISSFDDFISKISYENIKKAVLAERVEVALIENYDITADNIKLFANSIKMFCFEKMEQKLPYH